MSTIISTRYTTIGIVAAMLVVASTAWAKGPRPNLITCTDADKTVSSRMRPRPSLVNHSSPCGWARNNCFHPRSTAA